MRRAANADEAARSDAVEAIVDHLFRHRAGQMVAVLTRIFGFAHLDLVEDVVQDALVTALSRWPHTGVPENPGAWIVRVARNRALDQIRRRSNWHGKAAAVRQSMDGLAALDDAGETPARYAAELRDDQLRMIFACCHPALALDAQVALTLKSVVALSVDEIARAFLAQPKAIAQRLVRAKRRLRSQRVALAIPPPGQLPSRLDAVLEVLYLLFNEGYSATAGEDLVRRDLCSEAIRLASMLAAAPATGAPRTHALAALLCFQSARFDSRLDADGVPLRLGDQDRSGWDRAMIGRGFRHLACAGRGDSLSRYHLEAEIAAYHAASPRAEDTDWKRILECYDTLMRLFPTPVVALNRVVALAEVAGAEAALEAIEPLAAEPELAAYPLLWSTRGELRSRLGRARDAAADFDRARSLTLSTPAERFLARRFAEVGGVQSTRASDDVDSCR